MNDHKKDKFNDAGNTFWRMVQGRYFPNQPCFEVLDVSPSYLEALERVVILLGSCFDYFCSLICYFLSVLTSPYALDDYFLRTLGLLLFLLPSEDGTSSFLFSSYSMNLSLYFLVMVK